METRQSSKDIMLAHSAAKVEYYQRYLERYLSIMSNSAKIDIVNVVDVFCGRGVYADGGLGSPIRAVQVAEKIRKSHPSDTEFYFYFNDSELEYVKKVKEYINEHYPDNEKYCKIRYMNIPAEYLFIKLICGLEGTSYGTMNFLFIDPYGYKDIHKSTLQRLLYKQNTEVLLFLPISFMHRFSHYAFNEEANNGALRLREFIEEFFPKDHKVRSDEPMDVLEYIDALAEAFSFQGKLYTSAYFIQRDSRNYFALFSICHSLLGLEKAIETKWSLDEDNGQGFTLPDKESEDDLFSDYFKKERKVEHFETLKTLLLLYLNRPEGRTNSRIYRFVLRHGFLPKHANEVLRDLQDKNQIKVLLFESGKEARKHSFYINYKDANDIYVPKAIIKLIK